MKPKCVCGEPIIFAWGTVPENRWEEIVVKIKDKTFPKFGDLYICRKCPQSGKVSLKNYFVFPLHFGKNCILYKNGIVFSRDVPHHFAMYNLRLWFSGRPRPVERWYEKSVESQLGSISILCHSHRVKVPTQTIISRSFFYGIIELDSLYELAAFTKMRDFFRDLYFVGE